MRNQRANPNMDMDMESRCNCNYKLHPLNGPFAPSRCALCTKNRLAAVIGAIDLFVFALVVYKITSST